MKFYLAMSLLAFSLSTWAQKTLEVSASTIAGGGPVSMLDVGGEYEVVETGNPENPVNWDLTFDLMQAGRSDSRAIPREINDNYATFDPVKGDAIFGTIGIQGRKFLVKDLIEASIRAEYGQRLYENGSTWREAYGERYNEFGGVSASAGVAVIASKKIAIGATVNRNFSSGTTTVRFKIGYKFSLRND